MGAYSTVHLWDTNTRQKLVTLNGHTEGLRSVALSPDGKTVTAVSRDGIVKLWATGMREELATLKEHSEWVNAVAISPDGKTLASASKDKTVKLWDISTRQELATLRGHTEPVTSVVFSPDGPAVRIILLAFGIALVFAAWYVGTEWWTTPVTFVVKGMARESPPLEIAAVIVAITLTVYVAYVIGRDG